MNLLDQTTNRLNKGYIDKCQEYLDYILEHINNVNIAYNSLYFNNLKPLSECKGIEEFEQDQLEKILEQLELEIQNHDKSKMTDIEFYPYRINHYPTDYEKEKMQNDSNYMAEVNSLYQEAWKHHYTNNSHHPKYWINDDGSIRDMDIINILHMIADWEAMSIKYKSSTIDWYINKADDEKAAMSKETKRKVEILLNYLYDAEINKEG